LTRRALIFALPPFFHSSSTDSLPLGSFKDIQGSVLPVIPVRRDVHICLKAGLLERYHITNAYLALDPCVVVSAKYLSSSRTPLDRYTLFTALSHLVGTIGTFSTQIKGEDIGNPVFIRLRNVVLSRIVSIYPDRENTLEEIMLSNLHLKLPLDSEDPLWRLALMPDGTVIFAFHHAMADGQSGPVLHRLLLLARNSTKLYSTTAETPDIVPVPHNLTISPPVEDVVDLSVSLGTTIQELGGMALPALLSKDPTAWSGNPIIKEGSAKNNIRLEQIASSDASRLLPVTRAHKSTLTSLFHTLGTAVLTDLILNSPRPRDESYMMISTTIPFSLRRVAGTGPDVICDHISIHHTYPKFPQQQLEPSSGWQPYFSWDNAAKLAIELRQGTD